MKLYSLPHSPYSAKVRLQIYHKNLAVEIVAPPGFRDGTFTQINPTGKVPALDTGSMVLPESNVILDYLEDLHPAHPMRPADPDSRAIMNLLMRFSDIYIQPALFPVFRELMVKSGDNNIVEDGIVELKKTLALLDEMIVKYRPKHNSLDLADCALAPQIYYSLLVPKLFGEENMLVNLDALNSWWQWLNEQDEVKKVFSEIDEGLKALFERING
jgi:glutathione S-transferase